MPADRIPTKHFFDELYDERKLILFVDQNDFKISEKMAFEENVFAHFDIDKMSKLSLSTSDKAKIALTKGLRVYFYKNWLMVRPFIKTERRIQKIRALGIRLVNIEDQKYFQLPVGHPQEGLVYVGHPISRTSYSPFNDFHRATFEHKFFELMKLLSSLGARRIQAKHIQGYGNEVLAGADLPAYSAYGVAQGQANVHVQANNRQSIVYEETIEHNTSRCLPPDMIWFDKESAWQHIAAQRLNPKMDTTEWELDLTYSDNFGVTEKLQISLAQMGGIMSDISIKKFSYTIWHISVEFEPRSTK
jgi:hypothetical protein